MAKNYDLTALALKMVLPNNELIYDNDGTNEGLPSVMVRIPKFRMSDVITGGSSDTHPAFIINGQEVDEIYVSKYLNIVENGKAYSLPGQDPRANVTFDQAVQYCTAKGDGWHLMTNAEWAALELWCLKNGCEPRGNTSFGKDPKDTGYKAIPSMARDGSNRIQRTATGTGGPGWSHDGTLAGVMDLKGDVWEWQGGIRTVRGEVQIFAQNSAADLDNPQNATSVYWKAIDATTGSLVDPGSANTVKMDTVSGKLQYVVTIANQEDAGKSCKFSEITCGASIAAAAQAVLQAYGLLPVAGNTYDSDEACYWNNGAEERLVYRGGHWYYASYGFCSFDGLCPRSGSYAYIGFRSAYYKKI